MRCAKHDRREARVQMKPEGRPTHSAHPPAAPLPGEAATCAAHVRFRLIGLALRVILLHGPQALLGERPGR
jgi:hypothetical protein